YSTMIAYSPTVRARAGRPARIPESPRWLHPTRCFCRKSHRAGWHCPREQPAPGLAGNSMHDLVQPGAHDGDPQLVAGAVHVQAVLDEPVRRGLAVTAEHRRERVQVGQALLRGGVGTNEVI